MKLRVGQNVSIPAKLTCDPVQKQGEEGVIIDIDWGTVLVKFADGKKGFYDVSIWEDAR
jgi:hypothetical protein